MSDILIIVINFQVLWTPKYIYVIVDMFLKAVNVISYELSLLKILQSRNADFNILV